MSVAFGFPSAGTCLSKLQNIRTCVKGQPSRLSAEIKTSNRRGESDVSKVRHGGTYFDRHEPVTIQQQAQTNRGHDIRT